MPKNGWLLALAFVVSGLQMPAYGATAIADEPGVSGYFLLGAAGASIESNLIAKAAGGGGDLSDDEIDNIDDAPDSESATLPVLDLSLTYTFDNLKTELFLGNSLEDFLRFDFSTVIGLRHQLADVGIFEVGLLTTPGPTELWEDPYATGVERDETDRNSKGIRLTWGAIMGSGFDFRISARDNDIDDEKSGDSLVAIGRITKGEQELLDRNGDINNTSLIYNWDKGKGQLLSLTATYLEHDLDGEAMSFDGYSLQLNDLTAFSPRLRLSTNILLGHYEHDTENPAYRKKNDKNLIGLTLTLFLKDPLGATGWIGNLAVAYAEEANAIDFYDTTISLISIGMLHRF